MALAVVDAKNVIETDKIDGIDAVYTINLPAEEVENVNQTLVLITDANTNLGGYGSNHFNTLRREVEVQVFYALHPSVSIDDVEVSLYRAFENAGWEIGETHGHTYDPETHQLTVTMYLYQTKVVND